MKQIILYLFIFLLMLTGCATQTSPQPTTTNTEINSTQLIIDIDKERKSDTELRGKETLLIDNPIYIGDNDEVAFIGDTIQEKSPIKVKIGDNDEVSFSGNNFTISTSELRNGDLIQMTDHAGNIFVEIEVIR
jgi:hypothetical protein